MERYVAAAVSSPRAPHRRSGAADGFPGFPALATQNEAWLMAGAEAHFSSEVDFDALPIPVGEYWKIETNDAYAMTDKPARGAGSVTDDLESLVELLGRSEEEGVYLWHDLDHFCGLLRLLAFLDLPSPRG